MPARVKGFCGKIPLLIFCSQNQLRVLTPGLQSIIKLVDVLCCVRDLLNLKLCSIFGPNLWGKGSDDY